MAANLANLGKSTLTVGRVILGSGPGANSMVLHSLGYRASAAVKVPVLQIGSLGAKEFGWPKMPWDLSMGQTDALLLRSGSKQAGFTKTHKFNEFENQMANFIAKLADNRIMKLDGEVISVRKWGRKDIHCRIKTKYGFEEVIAEEVIGAIGAGPEREVAMPVQRRAGRARTFAEFTTGIKSLTGTTPMVFGSTVVLFGDGPTVLWNALAYRNAGNSVFVIAQPSADPFGAANPGGRNSEILAWLKAEDRLWCATPEGVAQRDNLKYLSDPTEPGMLLYLKDAYSISSGKAMKSFVLPTSQIVSSIGSIPRTLDIFDASSRNDFQALTLSGHVEQEYGVAISNTDRDIIVIGAAAADASGEFMARSLFSAAGTRIFQPDKGILATRHAAQMAQWITEATAMGGDVGDIASALKYLSRSIEVDPYTANSFQFAQFLADMGVSNMDIPEMVPALIKHREAKVKASKGFSNLDLVKFVKEGK